MSDAEQDGLTCFWCRNTIEEPRKLSADKRRELVKSHMESCASGPLYYAMKRDRLSSAYLRRAISVLRTVDTPAAAAILEDLRRWVWPPCEPKPGDDEQTIAEHRQAKQEWKQGDLFYQWSDT